jgi:hypothetical protein
VLECGPFRQVGLYLFLTNDITIRCGNCCNIGLVIIIIIIIVVIVLVVVVVVVVVAIVDVFLVVVVGDD